MAACVLQYRLANDCPLPWPAHPAYPIDAPAVQSSPVKRETSISPSKSGGAWLRNAYLDALYADAAANAAEHRILALAKALRKRRETVVPALEASLLDLEHFDRKWRADVLKTLNVPATVEGPLQEDERERLADYLAPKDIPEMAPEVMAPPPKRTAPRETLQQLEIVEVKLQVLLGLELMARRGTAHEGESDSLLRMYIDRLVIHQALSGLGGFHQAESQQGGVELDEVQRFWHAIEDIYVSLLPPAIIDRIRAKLFTSSALARLPSLSAALPVTASSPFHHPTPDLRRLAQAVSDAAASNAASRIPESPTLAKFIANPAANMLNGTATSAAAPRPFARSRSTLGTAFLSGRQVSMGTRASSSIASASQSQQPVSRPDKRKAREPERIPPKQAAASSKVLVGATPRRQQQGRVLVPETPVAGMGGEETFRAVPDTPAGEIG